MLVEFTTLIFLILLLLGILQFKTQRRPKKFPPGPIGIPLFGYLPFLTLPPPIGLSKLSKKYGNVCSLFFANVPVVVISGPDLIKKVFKDDRFLGRPKLRAFIDRSWGKPMGLTFGEGIHWYELRKFTVRHLKTFGLGSRSMESLIKDEVDELIIELKRSLGEPIVITKYFEIPILNALWKIITGKRFSHTDPHLIQILHSFHQQFSAFEELGLVFFVDWFTRVFPNLSGWNKFMKMTNELYDFLKEQIDYHKGQIKLGKCRESDNLIRLYLKEIELTEDKSSVFFGAEGEKEVLVGLLDLFSAGVEPPTLVLSWSVLYLIAYPQIQEKLYIEIQSIIGNERSPAVTDRPQMPYFQSFLAETFRMSSVTSVGFTRAPLEDVELEGYIIPKGTMILGNTWELHHDANYWTNPEEFSPERFISPVSGKFIQNNDTLFPFTAGKRECIGKKLALDELFLFITNLVQNFEIENDPSSNTSPLSLDGIFGTMIKPKPFKVILNLRNK